MGHTLEQDCSGNGAVGYRWVIHWSRIAVVEVRWGTGGSYIGAGLQWWRCGGVQVRHTLEQVCSGGGAVGYRWVTVEQVSSGEGMMAWARLSSRGAEPTWWVTTRGPEARTRVPVAAK